MTSTAVSDETDLKRNEVLRFDDGLLTVKMTGHGSGNGWGSIAFHDRQIEIDADGFHIAEIPPSELRALRDFLNRVIEPAVSDETGREATRIDGQLTPAGMKRLASLLRTTKSAQLFTVAVEEAAEALDALGDAKTIKNAPNKLADDLERLCCAETEGKFFDLITENIGTILAALRGQAALTAAPVARAAWRHKKRGTVYVEVARGPLQASTRQPAEDDIIVCYRGADGRHFFREATEFEDGRFELVDAPESAPVAQEPVAWTDKRLAELVQFIDWDIGLTTAAEIRQLRDVFERAGVSPPATPAGLGADEIAPLIRLAMGSVADASYYGTRHSRALNEITVETTVNAILALLSRGSGSDQKSPQKDGSR